MCLQHKQNEISLSLELDILVQWTFIVDQMRTPWAMESNVMAGTSFNQENH